MASINDILNDKDLSFDNRLQKAIDLINNPIDDESIPNAICWIGYRVLYGNVSVSIYRKYKDTPHHVINDGLRARWIMSLAIVDLYIDISEGILDERKLKNAALIWVNKNVKNLWPPQILNYLRSTTLYAYYLYLSDRNEDCIDLCVNTIDQWRISACSFNIAEHPFRFTEMRDDFKCLQILVFLLRECKYISFDDYYWINLEIINKKENDNEPFFNRALRIFGNINKDKALWKQQ